MPRLQAALGIAIAATAFAGCGSTSSSAKDDPAAASTTSVERFTATPARPRGPRLKVVNSDYGRILADGHGRALYLFTADHGKRSTCSGDCATAWPPLLVKSRPAGGPGAKTGLIGTTRRTDDRRQATYAGHPVYYYEGDRSPGEVNCQAAFEFGGYWYVLRGDGRAVR
jgi:predicted lipoprotein with Yx(FWY)xxD motif